VATGLPVDVKKRGAAPFPTGNECDRICHAPRLRIISLSIATTAYIVRSCGQRGTKPEKHRKVRRGVQYNTTKLILDTGQEQAADAE